MEEQLDPLPGPLGFTASSPKWGETAAAPVGVRSSSRQKVPRTACLDGQLGTVQPQLAAANSPGFLPRVLVFLLFVSLPCCVTHEAPEQRANPAGIGENVGNLKHSGFCPPQLERHRGPLTPDVWCQLWLQMCWALAAWQPLAHSSSKCTCLLRPTFLRFLGSFSCSAASPVAFRLRQGDAAPCEEERVSVSEPRRVLPRLQDRELACPFLSSLLLNSCSSRMRPCEAASC